MVPSMISGGASSTAHQHRQRGSEKSACLPCSPEVSICQVQMHGERCKVLIRAGRPSYPQPYTHNFNAIVLCIDTSSNEQHASWQSS